VLPLLLLLPMIATAHVPVPLNVKSPMQYKSPPTCSTAHSTTRRTVL